MLLQSQEVVIINLRDQLNQAETDIKSRQGDLNHAITELAELRKQMTLLQHEHQVELTAITGDRDLQAQQLQRELAEAKAQLSVYISQAPGTLQEVG